MDMLNGIKNFLQFIEANWTNLIVIVGLSISLSRKVKAYFSKSNDEKIEIAKAQINQTMLKLVTEAEVDYLEWQSAGCVKRSQVIDKIFTMYPILSTVTNQEELIVWIDEEIDEALKTMREIFAVNAKENK